jgi:hypothetical protein
MFHPAPVVRAGAVSLLDNQPDSVAIPGWIKMLDDKDSVVRMNANEHLKERTGQDFGYIAWDEPENRAPAVAKWRAWWTQRAGASSATPDASQGGLVTRRRKR